MSWKDILKNNDEIKEWGTRIKELVKRHNLDAEESQIFGGTNNPPPVLFTIKNRKPNVYLGELKYPNDDMSDILDKLTMLTELMDSGVTVENTGYYYTTKLWGKSKLGERRENIVDIYDKYFYPNSDKDLARQEEPKGGPAGFRQRDDIMFDYEMD